MAFQNTCCDNSNNLSSNLSSSNHRLEVLVPLLAELLPPQLAVPVGQALPSKHSLSVQATCSNKPLLRPSKVATEEALVVVQVQVQVQAQLAVKLLATPR